MPSLYLGSIKIGSEVSLNVDPIPTYDNPTLIQIPATITTLANNMFEVTGSGRELALKFAGDPPTLGTTPFKNAKLTVYYKSSNTKWTSSIKTSWQNNGGASSITWKTY